MNRIISWGENLTPKQTITICLRAGAATFMVGMLGGLLVLHQIGVIG